MKISKKNNLKHKIYIIITDSNVGSNTIIKITKKKYENLNSIQFKSIHYYLVSKDVWVM